MIKSLKALGLILLAFVCFMLVANFAPPQKRMHHQLDVNYTVDDPQFIRTLGHLLGPPIVGGNRITSFYNGKEIFPAMLGAIHNAKKSITFESYIYWSGKVGDEFVQALSERARAGVKVHVLIDWLGSSRISEEYLKGLRAANVEVELFHPLKWYNLARLNNRTHRKILVIDGKIGFTGGVGIADEWEGDGDRPDIWRDSQFMLEGPAVNSLQSAFMDNWLKLRPEVHHDADYFPEVPPVGNSLSQVFISSPQEGSSSMRLMYMLAIAAAKESIDLESAYFVPDEVALEQLHKARDRGVRVRIIVPGSHTDTAVVEKASRSSWGKLLKDNIEIYEFQPAMFHCKVMIIDNKLVSVGSTNFDDRSFRLNDEANLNVIDANFAKHETQTFEKDLAHSRRVHLQEWRERSQIERWQEDLASLFSKQL